MLKFPLFQDHCANTSNLLCILQISRFQMGSRSTTPWWEAPKFSFNLPNQANAWKSFYTRVLDFLEALDIDPDVEDQGKKGWRQIKMMFEDEDCLAPPDPAWQPDHLPRCPVDSSLMLKAIKSVIKEDVHFWHHRDELLTDLQQLPDEGIHALSMPIITLMDKCKFPLQEVKELMQLMVLQHTVKYHEACDWICLQDQSALTYQSLLNYCTQFEARCNQFKRAQVQGRAQLTSITSASASQSLHIQSATTQITCKRCGYTHPHANCPTFNKECYSCHTKGHFTALCRKPKSNRWPNNSCWSSSRGRSRRSSSSASTRQCHRSQSRGGQPYRSPSTCRNSSNSRSPSQDHHNRRSPRQSRHSPTPFRYKVSHLTSSPNLSQVDESQLYTDRAPGGYRSFHTTLQLVTKQSCKSLWVKVDPGAEANIIPLSRYRSLFPHHFHTNGTLRANSLRKSKATWSPHDDTSHKFIGFFMVDVQQKTRTGAIPISFYVFKDSARPSTLLWYGASIHLGILEFKVPNKAKSYNINTISRKKSVSFNTPLCSSMPTKTTPQQSEKLKSALKQNTTFQDHQSQQVQPLQDHSQSFQDHFASFQDHSASFQDHSSAKTPIENNAFQDPVSVKDVQDVISLKKAFPQSFDTTGSMPGVYTIRLDPSVPPVQHARRKVPIECREAIEKLLQDMVDQAIIAPVTEPMGMGVILDIPPKARWFPPHMFRPPWPQ